MDLTPEIEQAYINWLNENGFDIDLFGPIEEWSFEPYFEELSHVLDDDNSKTPWPPIVMAYRLSLWAGKDVPVNHNMVTNYREHHKIAMDSLFDMGDDQKAIEQQKMILGIAGPELAENLASVEDVVSDLSKPKVGKVTDSTSLVNINGINYKVTTWDNYAAFMGPDGEVKAFDLDGNRVFKDETDRIMSYMAGAPSAAIDPGRLSSMIGNTLADLVMGKDSISILDLP